MRELPEKPSGILSQLLGSPTSRTKATEEDECDKQDKRALRKILPSLQKLLRHSTRRAHQHTYIVEKTVKITGRSRNNINMED